VVDSLLAEMRNGLPEAAATLLGGTPA